MLVRACAAAAVALAVAAAAPAVARPARGQVELPIVRQVLRNNCETAALSMLLAARRVRVDQLALQRALPRSGSLDPQTRADGTMVWGDPDKGFVGRAAGGGTSGGYGVYTPPIKALAARYGVRLMALSRRPAATLYSRLRAGRPVMVWIGLSDGPYRRWRSPGGKTIVGNFGEHTVVLTGIAGDTLFVNDPLTGLRVTWSRGAFERMWARLGQRALGV